MADAMQMSKVQPAFKDLKYEQSTNNLAFSFNQFYFAVTFDATELEQPLHIIFDQIIKQDFLPVGDGNSFWDFVSDPAAKIQVKDFRHHRGSTFISELCATLEKTADTTPEEEIEIVTQMTMKTKFNKTEDDKLQAFAKLPYVPIGNVSRRRVDQLNERYPDLDVSWQQTYFVAQNPSDARIYPGRTYYYCWSIHQGGWSILHNGGHLLPIMQGWTRLGAGK